MDPTPFPRLTGSADVSVRPARPGEAADIARVQAVTWRTAYRSVLPPELLDTWDEEGAAQAWRTAVEAPPTPAHLVLVALEQETIVGFTAVGPDVTELVHAATIAIAGEVTLDRLWHAVPAYPTKSEIWLRLLETAGR